VGVFRRARFDLSGKVEGGVLDALAASSDVGARADGLIALAVVEVFVVTHGAYGVREQAVGVVVRQGDSVSGDEVAASVVAEGLEQLFLWVVRRCDSFGQAVQLVVVKLLRSGREGWIFARFE